MISTFSDLTLGVFLKLAAIPEDIDPLDRQAEILAALSGCTAEDIYALPIEEYMHRVAASRFLEADLPKRIPQRWYLCGDFELECIRDWRTMTTAQFVDFKTYADRMDEKERALSVELLSCMLTPRGRAYCDGYDPVDVQASIRDHMRADDAVALSAFFLARWMRWSRHILACSRRAARKLRRRDIRREARETMRKGRRMLRTPSRRSGAGSPSSTR